MKTFRKTFPALLIPGLVLFMGIAFAQTQQEQAAPLEQATRAQKARTHKKAPAMAGAELGFGKMESLSGSLSTVDSAGKLVVVISPNGVPYDFQITPKTRIEVGGKTATLADLEGQIHKDVLVDFTPERGGNMAQSIKVAGG